MCAPLVLVLIANKNNLASYVNANYLLKRLSYLCSQLAMETAELEVCLCHLPAEKSKATCVDPRCRLEQLSHLFDNASCMLEQLSYLFDNTSCLLEQLRYLS